MAQSAACGRLVQHESRAFCLWRVEQLCPLTALEGRARAEVMSEQHTTVLHSSPSAWFTNESRDVRCPDSYSGFRVFLGASLEVLDGRRQGLGVSCVLSTGCHQGILPCSSPLTQLFASLNC